MPKPVRYNHVMSLIRERIASGEYPEGACLPLGVSLADELGISRSCVRRALQSLCGEGILESRQGLGYAVLARKLQVPFVCEDMAVLMRINFAEWNLGIFACFLYTLLEQRALRAGGSFKHIQIGEDISAETLITMVEASKAKWVVVELSVLNQLKDGQLFCRILEDMPCRVVCIGRGGELPARPFDLVSADWGYGTRKAVAHLLRKGHRDIVFAGVDGASWSNERQAVFLSSLRQSKLWDLERPLPCVPSPEGIKYALSGQPEKSAYAQVAANLSAWLDHHSPDAVICANDDTAMELAALKPLSELPELLSFDNSIWSAQNCVSSVGMDMPRMADKIFELLASPPAEHTRQVNVPTLLAAR